MAIGGDGDSQQETRSRNESESLNPPGGVKEGFANRAVGGGGGGGGGASKPEGEVPLTHSPTHTAGLSPGQAASPYYVRTGEHDTDTEEDSTETEGTPSPEQGARGPSPIAMEEGLTETTERVAASQKERIFYSMLAAVEAAETVRTTGNVAFTAGSYQNALTLYSVALRHLEEARKLQTEEESVTGENGNRMWNCMQACHLNSAMCFLKLERWQDCADSCNIILQAEEDCVKALYRSGLAYLHLGEYKQAVENLLKAHDLSPDDKTITKDLARAITMQKKSEKADGDPLRAFAKNMLNPKSPDRNPAKGSKAGADESLDAGTEDDGDESYDHGSLSDGCTEDEELDSADEDEDEEDEEDDDDDEDDYGLDDSYEADDPSGKSPQAPADNIFRFRGMRDELDDAFEGAQKMQDQLETVKGELEEMWAYARELRAESEAAMTGGAGTMEDDEEEEEEEEEEDDDDDDDDDDTDEDDEETHWERDAIKRFKSLGEGAAASPAAPAAPATPAAPAATAVPAAGDGEDNGLTPIEQAAEKCKQRGNQAFGALRTNMALTEYTEAISMSKLKTFTKPELACIYYSNRAAAYMRLERFEEAADDCKEAMRLDPGFWKAARRGGQALVKLGDFDEAVRCFEAAMQSKDVARDVNAELSEARRMQGEIRKVHQLMEAGDAERALLCIKSISAEVSGGTVLKVLHAKVLMRCSKFDEAAQHIQALRAQGALDMKTEQDLNLLAAKAMVGMAKMPEAIRMLRDLLRRDPDNEQIKSELKLARAMHEKMEEGDTATRLERFDAARKAYTSAMEMDSTNLQFKARMLCQRAAAFEKQRSKAIDGEKELEEAQKEVKEAQEALAAAQRRLVRGHDRLKGAERTSARLSAEFEEEEKASSGKVVDPTAPYVQAQSHNVKAKWALFRAIEEASMALDLDPECGGALIHRARCMSEIGDHSEAVADYERAQACEKLDRSEFSPHTISAELRAVQAKLKSSPPSHYKVLGLPDSSTAEEIKKAYKRMAIKYHPDKQSHLGKEAAERMGRRFNQISEAHSVLTNPTEKRLYDMKLRRGGMGGARSHGASYGGGGYGGFGGYGGGSSRSYGGMFGSDDEDGW